MTTFTKDKLSGSTNGKQIKVAATSTPGTTIHTAVSGSVSWDEIWIYAINTDSADRVLTIEWGEATAPDGNIIVTVPFKAGLLLVIPGLVLQNALVVKAFASAANVICISGFVNRIS
jgi:hypothetical protein